MADTFDALFQSALDEFEGKETRLARACQVSQNAIWAARRAGRVSPQLAQKIDAATSGKVPKWKLRPDIWEQPPAPPEASAA